jgi:hypothetical protein
MDKLGAFTQFADMVNQKLETKDRIDINKLISSEIGGVVDFGIWQETVELQKAFNERVAPGWQLDIHQKKYNYWMAILDETVEVLNSKHWKWWKNGTKMGEVDWDNIQVELIDLFHFILSIAIQHDSESIIFTQLVNVEINKDEMYKNKIKNDSFFNDFWDNFLMAVQMKNLPLVAIYWVEFWYRAGGNAERLFMEYRIKVALNNIRQEFGYGSANNYQKMWIDVDTGQKVEDNVIAWKIAKDLELSTNLADEITERLKEYYLKHVAI